MDSGFCEEIVGVLCVGWERGKEGGLRVFFVGGVVEMFRVYGEGRV